MKILQNQTEYHHLRIIWFKKILFMKRFFLVLAAIGFIGSIEAQQVDFSVVSVPEESGLNITRISSDNDCIVLPAVIRKKNGVTWLSNRIVRVTPDGESIAYLAKRNGMTNIFVKNLDKQGSAIQRTNRQEVLDFSYSPDGKVMCFSEHRGAEYQIFQTDAVNGYVCRQITSGSLDFSPVFSSNQSQIFFARQENKSQSIWSFDVKSKFLSSYSSGMNPCPLKGEPAYLCTRIGPNGRGEIWKVNYETNSDECIVSDINRGFSSPVVSPDGKWILLVGESIIDLPKKKYYNTDLYVCRIDGTQLTQLTFHAADDLSPVWSKDGKSIYFISQRGSATATANIWKMDFVVF